MTDTMKMEMLKQTNTHEKLAKINDMLTKKRASRATGKFLLSAGLMTCALITPLVRPLRH